MSEQATAQVTPLPVKKPRRKGELRRLREENAALRHALGRLVGVKQVDAYLAAVAEGRSSY